MARDALESPLQTAAPPATARLTSTAGPARPAPIAVVTKSPVPTMAPIPKPTALVSPTLRSRTGSGEAAATDLFRPELDDPRVGPLGDVQPQVRLVRGAVAGHAALHLGLIGGDELFLLLCF